jgi:Peptidase M15
MITMQEILKDKKLEDQSAEIQANLVILLERMNKVRELYGKPMLITSGLRTEADQIRVYAEKGITDLKKIPMKSKHLKGNAVDVSDPKGELNDWCKKNEETLRELGIWLETRQGGWQHFQIVPYGSYTDKKTIFFNP